jgi:hypothetical protein
MTGKNRRNLGEVAIFGSFKWTAEHMSAVETPSTLNNVHAALLPEDSEMAAQVFINPYLFEFLGTAAPKARKRGWTGFRKFKGCNAA